MSTAPTPSSILSSMSFPDMDVHQVPGRLTGLKCTCGGLLREARTVIVPKSHPPHHRKRRIRKKWLRRWKEEHRVHVGVGVMMGLMQRPTYQCESCGRRDGFYSAMGRNLFTIERLPERARPIWDRKPER